MKRQFAVPVEETGTPEAQNQALALSAVAGPEFIRAVIDLKCAMDRFGGEAYIGCYRDKFQRQIVETEDGEFEDLVKVGSKETGEWMTLGFVCHYESVAKLTKGVTGAEREPDDKLNAPRPLAQDAEQPDTDREKLEEAVAA